MLMALLFVGGVMNLWWVVTLTLLIALEKLVKGGQALARLTGLALIAWGFALLLV
jgi:predicted metal-binding membrane protein